MYKWALKNIWAVLAITTILILTIISIMPSSYAQVQFSDNFDDNNISEYQQFGGTWTTVLESGTDYVLRHTSNANTVIFPQSESFSNSYQVIAEIWNEDNDAGGVAFGINPADPDNLYSCSATSDSGFNAGLWEHVNDVDGVPTNQLATQSWNYQRSTWYTVTITVDQNTNTINCTWQSQAGVELDVTAAMPSSISGSVGFWLSHQDNFKGNLLEVRTLGPADTEPPQLSVQDPQNITYNISDVPLNYIVSDNVQLSGCSYELDGITTSLPNCQNSILSSLTLQSHSITVSATDTSDNTSTSPQIVFSVDADTSPPQWNPDPENIVLLDGQSLFYDADAIDNVAVASFSIDDTINFQIDPISGILENRIPLSVTTYPLSLSVSDTSGNVNTKSITIIVQEVGVTPPGYKVAFIGDQGSGSSATAVLNLILNEGADMVLHQGDFDYNDNPDAWDGKITTVLGSDYPYFASIGNHDVAAWPGYQQKLIERLARINGAVCTGDIGVKASCTYNGLFFVLSGVGTMGSGHDTYIRDEMALDNSIWRICSWHKNMNAMQVGTKSDATGWEVYEECRIAGAIIATGHEHSYSRTRTLTSIQNQIVDPDWPETNNVRVGEGSSFVFVSGLGGASIRNQDRCLPFTFPYGCNGEWASIYTSDQNANHGALFCSFNVGGQANKANCYFKDISGNIPDQFDVTSFNSVPVGSSPTAQPDTATTAEDSSVNVNVLANDTDPDGDTLLLASFDLTSSNGGTIVRDDNATPGNTSDDKLVYTPSLNFNGVDTFNYSVSDGTQSDAGSVTITVTAVNDAPTADDQSVVTSQDTSVDITLTGSDVDADSLTFAIVAGPSNGALSNFDSVSGTVTYAPNSGFFGSDTFTFNVNDSLVVSNTAAVSITVEETNVAPILNSIGNKLTDELALLTFTATATDANSGQTLTFSLGGSVPAGASITSAGVFSWTPSESQGPGIYSFDVIVTDDGFPTLSDSETIDVTVNEINLAPTADDQSVTTQQDTAVSITLTANDADGDPLTYSVTSNPTNGLLTGTAPNLTYIPNQSFFGNDVFTFVANDGLVDSNTATVSITINEIPPTQQLFFDNFDDNNISEYQQFGGTWTTVLESGTDYVLRHTSNANTVIFPQSESFSNSYQVIAEIWNEDNDAGGVAFGINPLDPDNLYSCSATADGEFNAGFWQHVNDVAGTPTNQLATQSWNYQRSTWYTVTITVDQNTNTINCTWQSQAGVELDVTAAMPSSISGSVGFWLSSQDNFKGNLLEVRTLGPPPPNTPPTANDDSYSAVIDTTLNVLSPGVLENDLDVDGNQLTAILATGPTHGSLTLNLDGSFQYNPDQGYLGPDSFSYAANDGEASSNIATVSLTISEQPNIQQAFFDDFESPVGNGGFSQWTESGESDWIIKLPDESNIPGFSSSNLVAHADNCDTFCELTVTNSIDLSSYTSATLTFWRYVDASLDNNEYLKVKISSNGGSSWTEIASWTHRNGDDDQWHQETFDLGGYLTSNFKVQFVTKESSTGEDVAIDNVLVEGTT